MKAVDVRETIEDAKSFAGIRKIKVKSGPDY